MLTPLLVNDHKQIVSLRKKAYREAKKVLITEHMFGTIEQQMGYTHTNMRRKEKIPEEVGLMFTIYNLMRVVRFYMSMNC